VAWGECGLDYAKNNSPPEVQRRVFAQQIVKAVEVGKPLVVHSRKAEDDTIALLKENMPKEWHVHVRLSVPLLCPPHQLTLIASGLFP
jgi:TatD DNase family protein